MEKATEKNGSENKALALIDPIYQKYVKSVLRALSSTDFYEFFMDSVSRAENSIQFSNRRAERLVDLTWVDAIEDALEALQNISSSPRNVIREDEIIVNVANAKKGGNDVVRHLATHAAFVEDYNTESGDVRPNKLMQKYREDSIGIYENRLVFTALEQAHHFVKIRHDALFGVMGDEFGAKLKVESDMNSATEMVHLDMFLHIRDTDGAIQTDAKNREVFDRISRLYRILSMVMNSRFAQQMAKLPRVKGTITKTNVLKRNPDYRAIVKLMEFLRSYNDIGYVIKVSEQNPVIDEAFERDIYHNILFNYIVLKGHLERDKDRLLPLPAKEKKRSLKPKFIKEIIEEMTEDYDLPDVEIRKILIEELTKEQLMMEEAAERRRLVEEQAQRRREEAERIRREKAEEKERLRLEKEKERERLRQEKAAEAERLLQERMEREQEDRRRSKLFRTEIAYFNDNKNDRLAARLGQEQEEAVRQDFEDAAWVVEETERIKREAANRERQRRRDERERKIREELELRQRALREEAMQREKLRLEEEARQKAIEQEALRQREEKDRARVSAYLEQLQSFRAQLGAHLQERSNYLLQIKREQEERERERQNRLQARRFFNK